MIKNIPNAVINIPLKQEFKDQHPVFEVIVKQDGKLIYHNKTYAMVMNLVQSITKLDPSDLSLEGDSQILCVGHPIVQFFALDQLMIKMKKAGVMEQAIQGMHLITKHPELKVQLDKIAKANSIKK